MDLEPKWSGIPNSPTESHSVTSASLLCHWLYSPWNSSAQNSELGNLSLLQGIFATQGSNPGLLHCRQILYQLSHKETPRVQESQSNSSRIVVKTTKAIDIGGRSQDGRGIGRGDHFLSYKFMERRIEWWTKFTKKLLIPSSGHQVPRKAAHCLRREVGQNIRDKKGDKRARDRDPSGKGVLIEEVSNHQETLTLVGLREVFKSRRAT